MQGNESGGFAALCRGKVGEKRGYKTGWSGVVGRVACCPIRVKGGRGLLYFSFESEKGVKTGKNGLKRGMKITLLWNSNFMPV